MLRFSTIVKDQVKWCKDFTSIRIFNNSKKFKGLTYLFKSLEKDYLEKIYFMGLELGILPKRLFFQESFSFRAKKFCE